MAYMNQEKKMKIAAKLKEVMPKDWRWSLSVRNYSAIVLTISAAPFNLLKEESRQYGYQQFNVYHPHLCVAADSPTDTLPIFEQIIAALNTDNFDKSDSTVDYFHVGHYVDINIGRWDKPFKVVA